MSELQAVPTSQLKEELKKRDEQEKAVATIRMPAETLKQAHAQARREGLSLNLWVLQLIESQLHKKD